MGLQLFRLVLRYESGEFSALMKKMKRLIRSRIFWNSLYLHNNYKNLYNIMHGSFSYLYNIFKYLFNIKIYLNNKYFNLQDMNILK